MTEAPKANANFKLIKQRNNFEFQDKKVAFFHNKSMIGKQKYFRQAGGNSVVSDLIILTEQEKKQTNGYDAIIVSWRKQGVTRGFRKRLIKRLN